MSKHEKDLIMSYGDVMAMLPILEQLVEEYMTDGEDSIVGRSVKMHHNGDSVSFYLKDIGGVDVVEHSVDLSFRVLDELPRDEVREFVLGTVNEAIKKAEV